MSAGDLYAALPGFNAHGADFAGEAIAAGAVAVLTDAAGLERLEQAGQPGQPERLGSPRVPVLVAAHPREVLGELAATVYGHPAEGLTTLGVTGTNGKTTTAYLIESALRARGQRTGLIGTVETRIGDERLDSVRTTPEATDLHALLGIMRERGIDACVMEVSSHALELHRVDGVVYDVALFTNLSQDHLDFHASMEDYFAAKASLFTPARSRAAVVCVDDAWGARLAREATVPTVTFASAPADGVDWVIEEGAGGSFAVRETEGERGALPRVAPARPLQRRQHRPRGSRPADARPRGRPRCSRRWPCRPTCPDAWRSWRPVAPTARGASSTSPTPPTRSMPPSTPCGPRPRAG